MAKSYNFTAKRYNLISYNSITTNTAGNTSLKTLHGESISCQQKRKVKEVIRDFKEANLTFPVSEADFILREWNFTVDQEKKKKIIEAKKHGLPPPSPKKKNLTVEITSPSIIYAPLTIKTVTSQANAPIVTETAGLPLSNIELNTPVTNNIVNLSSTTSEVNTPAATEIAVETPGKKRKGKRE
ncbi:hypothetical protein RhiirC2_797461 [Rhizophagus irregularis]|uniref:Uncharacterized protein n=1 Tax=Rhizophagus irregularis TaxID=588596 RepID=A0A2N1M800_9GLOM|nr:hypothetical protein RhiirC2_797461 [Rhizophagus irregularis]